MTRAETTLAFIRDEVEHPDAKKWVDDPATSLRDLRIDGASRAHLALRLEDEFHLTLTDETVQGWTEVGDVLRSVSQS
jgi:acyl carrier protein